MARWSRCLLGLGWLAAAGCLPASGGGGAEGDAGQEDLGIGAPEALPESGIIILDGADAVFGDAGDAPSPLPMMDAAAPGRDRGPVPRLDDADTLDLRDGAPGPRDAGPSRRDAVLEMRDARVLRPPDAAVPAPLAECPDEGLGPRCAAACETILACALTDECPGLDPVQRAQYLARCQVACEADPASIAALCEAPRCGPVLVAAESIMPGFIDECLHGPPWTACMDLALCAFDCRRDAACVEACAAAGTEAAQALFEPLWTCIRPRGCVAESGLPDSDCVNRLCRDPWAECFAPAAPEAPGCIMALNCGSRCPDLDCVDACLERVTRAGREAFIAVNECAARNQCQDIGCVVQRCPQEMRACHETDPGERGCDAIHTCFWGGANHPLSEYCPLHGRPEAQEAFYRYLACVQSVGCVGRAACDRACLEPFALCWDIR